VTQQVAHARPAVERWLVLSGLVPLPAFLALHLARELSLAFATDVSDVVRPGTSAWQTFSSVVLVWLPLALHVGLGSWRLLAFDQPLPVIADVPRLARQLSRFTSVLSLAFLLYHGQKFPFAVWRGDAAAEDSGFRLIAELSSSTWGAPVVGGMYLLGLLATVTHAGLGVHRGLLLLGRLSTPPRRLISARACAAFGATCFCLGAAAVIRVATGVLLR